jgi:hypothetical protein
MPAFPGVVEVARDAQQWIVEVKGPLGALVSALAGLPIADIKVDGFTLDDTILRLLGGHTR